MKKSVVLLFCVAFLIRLIAADQSLWLDEGVTAKVVSQYSFFEIIQKFSPTDFHPPLYYLFMKLWTGLFGVSELSLRMPSILFSLGTGVLLYCMFGTLVAGFFLFNPLIVYYSQEARMYSLALFLLTAGVYFVEKRSAKKSISYSFYAGLFFSLAFGVFYGSIFFIAAIFIYLFFRKKYKRLAVVSIPLVVVFIALLPLLFQQFVFSREALTQVPHWKRVLGTSSIKNILLIPIKFSSGRVSFNPKLLYYVLAGMWSVFAFIIAFLGMFKKPFFAILFFVPLILGFFVSFWSPLLQYFRFLYLIPILCVCMAIGARRHKTLPVILLTGFALWSLLYLLVPSFHRENWKELSQSVDKKARVYMIQSASDPLLYYRPDIKVQELRETAVKKPLAREILVIPYVTDIHGFDYKGVLQKHSYERIEEKSYRGVTLEKWRKINYN